MQKYRIPLHKPQILGNELEYVREALEGGEFASGPFVKMLEDTVLGKAVLNAEGDAWTAVAVSSATAGLEIALGMICEPGASVIVPDLTFGGTVNAVLAANCSPIIVDVESDFWQLDEFKTKEYCERNKVDVILAVDLLGHPANMQALEDCGPPVLEDAAEALGSGHAGEAVPAAAVGVFSFNGNKIVSGGGGGMIIAPKSMEEALRIYANQGMAEAGIHTTPGYNHRMSNLQAAVAVGQIERLPWVLERKAFIADYYMKNLASVEGLAFMNKAEWAEPNYWLVPILLPDPAQMAAALAAFEEVGIEVRRMFRPLSMQPAYKDFPTFEIEHSVKIWERCICLPSGVGLTASDQDEVIQVLKDVINVG